jgi:hypothetical protein
MQDFNKRPPLKDITSKKASAEMMARLFSEQPNHQLSDEEGTQLSGFKQ